MDLALWWRERLEGVGIRISIVAAMDVSSNDEDGVALVMCHLMEEGEELWRIT